MAAKNRPATRTRPDDVTPWDSSGALVRASHRREDLIEEARALMAAGKVREARAVEKRAGQVEQLVGALDVEGRMKSRDLT